MGKGETVALVGSQRGGEDQSLKAVMGLVAAFRRQNLSGRERRHRLAGAGHGCPGGGPVPRGPEMFGELTVKENLELGAWPCTRGAAN